MAKLKKLVLLCTALMMTASVAALAACGEGKKPSSSPDVSDSTPTEGNSSPDDSSSVDGGDETPDDVVYYEEIVAGGEGSLAGTAWTDSFGTLTLTIAEAGTYGIYTEGGDVSFGAEGSTDGWSDFMTNYTFEAEAGEITLATYVNPMSDGEVAYSYYLYKLNALTITEMTGEAEIASNLRAPVIFNAPAAGDYLITTDMDLNWYNTAEKSDEGMYSSSFLLSASEAGEIPFYVMLNDFAQDKLVFTWNILSISDVSLSDTETTVDLYAGVYRKVTFTATQNAIYSVTAESEQYGLMAGVYGVDEYGGMSWIEGNYENSFTFYLNAGETKTLHILYSGYDLDYNVGPAQIEAKATVSSIEAADPANLAVGDNIFMATEEGVQATFTAEVAGTYYISEANNAMYFEDTEVGEWGGDSYKEVTLAAGESVSFTVKYNNLVTIAIEKAPESINLSVGENTINVPAETAYLNFTDAEMDATYTLSFNGALVSIVLDQGGMQTEIFADTEFTYNPWHNYIITSKTGEAIENLAITVTFVSGAEGGGDIGGGEEETYAPLILGENAITVTVESYYCAGTNVTFTALEAGEYVLNIAEGEENADVYTLPDYEMVEFPYAFTLGEGESISFNVATTAIMTLTEDVIDLFLEKVGGETEEPVEDKVTITVDETNELTIGAGYYVTNDNALTLNGEYTFDWNVFVSNEDTEDVNDTVAVDDSYITVLVNGEEIESGAKITYSEDTVVTLVIKSSDTTKNTYVSFTVTKTPETVQPDNEWTNNY